MFTGLIQAVAKVQYQGNNLFVEGNELPFSINIGDSVSVDGVCLTIAAFRGNGFLANISEETLQRTTLGKKAAEKGFVNLEPALCLSDRLGGHLVSGHVDGLGTVSSLDNLPNSWNLEINWQNSSFAKYICDKASICLNGISLTVSGQKKEGKVFSIAVIPHTWINTSLQYLRIGDLVNLEADLMAKYAEKLLLERFPSNNQKLSNNQPDISTDWLVNQGWQ
ncbi:riboflavin synthase [Prochlorococcus marinus]|uniref:Riboflavin synthase n=1 Tax=Prochlorococcus marinus (strain MIT 9211) TaxID=93059 RepID=A9BE60_PROM4|nr:riboflavin synthase [Prochlorococcus marinus]ABX08370.1 Putative Riboflavin synthase alpha chain [Prochlorococcus marinus str. MIT 9211]